MGGSREEWGEGSKVTANGDAAAETGLLMTKLLTILVILIFWACKQRVWGKGLTLIYEVVF